MTTGSERDIMSDDPIHELISSYLELPGIMAAVLVSDQGLVINAARRGDVDTEMISALVVDTVKSAERFGHEAGVGRLDTLSVEYEGLSFLLAPFERDMMLALVAAPGTFALRSGLGS
jgi:predicted regulator of Ras-like GTPase activity (Roadblock/LC7/MglB family)